MLVEKTEALGIEQTCLNYYKWACDLENMLEIRPLNKEVVKPYSFLANKKMSWKQQLFTSFISTELIPAQHALPQSPPYINTCSAN
jgi:hypothetical protein